MFYIYLHISPTQMNDVFTICTYSHVYIRHVQIEYIYMSFINNSSFSPGVPTITFLTSLILSALPEPVMWRTLISFFKLFNIEAENGGDRSFISIEQ